MDQETMLIAWAIIAAIMFLPGAVMMLKCQWSRDGELSEWLWWSLLWPFTTPILIVGLYYSRQGAAR